MTRQNQVKGSTLSRLIMSVIMVLSLLAFSGSISANTGSRKPATRETIIQKKLTARRSISLRYAGQCLVSIDFFRSLDYISVKHSLSRHDRLLRIERCGHCNKKSPVPEAHEAIHLHTPRSADPITSSFRG